MGREEACLACVEKGAVMVGWLRAVRLPLDLPTARRGTTTGRWRAAKLLVASRRPSGAFEVNAEEIMLCAGEGSHDWMGRR